MTLIEKHNYKHLEKDLLIAKYKLERLSVLREEERGRAWQLLEMLLQDSATLSRTIVYVSRELRAVMSERQNTFSAQIQKLEQMLMALPTPQDLVQKQQSLTTTMLLPLETVQKFNELDAEFIHIEQKKLEDKIWKLK